MFRKRNPSQGQKVRSKSVHYTETEGDLFNIIVQIHRQLCPGRRMTEMTWREIHRIFNQHVPKERNRTMRALYYKWWKAEKKAGKKEHTQDPPVDGGARKPERELRRATTPLPEPQTEPQLLVNEVQVVQPPPLQHTGASLLENGPSRDWVSRSQEVGLLNSWTGGSWKDDEAQTKVDPWSQPSWYANTIVEDYPMLAGDSPGSLIQPWLSGFDYPSAVWPSEFDLSLTGWPSEFALHSEVWPGWY